MTQDDVLFPQLTVEETLVFAAFLRLPARMSKQQKRDRVDAIITELNLERSVSIFSSKEKKNYTDFTNISCQTNNLQLNTNPREAK